jgi:hypothetical protein
MDDCTTSSASSWERLRLLAALFPDLLFLLTLVCVLEGEDFFFTPLVGTENARLGEKVRAKVMTALNIIRFAIQNLLCYGTIRREPMLRHQPRTIGRFFCQLAD